MFKITSTRNVSWPSLQLRKGENEFTTSAEIPAELWPKLSVFRKLGVLEFDLKLDDSGVPAELHAPVKLEELTERHLFAMGKDALAELAKQNGVRVGESDEKAELIQALSGKLTRTEQVAPAASKPSKRTDPVGPVTIE